MCSEICSTKQCFFLNPSAKGYSTIIKLKHCHFPLMCARLALEALRLRDLSFLDEDAGLFQMLMASNASLSHYARLCSSRVFI